MKMHEIACPRPCSSCAAGNAGISHNPLESTVSDDIELAAQAFTHLLDRLAFEGHLP